MSTPITSLSVGLKVSAEQFGPRELVDYTVLADDMGLDSVWISDHFLPWRDNGGHAPFSLAWMAAAGERTRRVALGTSVLTPTFRYNPAVLAQAFATMGLLFPGRVILGVGTGEALNEKAVSGREWPEFKERFARLREAVAMMRALWTEDEVTRKGDFYEFVGAKVYDRPAVRCRCTSPPAARSWPGTPAGPVTASSAPRARACRSTPTISSRRSPPAQRRPGATSPPSTA